MNPNLQHICDKTSIYKGESSDMKLLFKVSNQNKKCASNSQFLN